MSKESSDTLFHLIQRMSKSEKRHFKLIPSRHEAADGKFIRLFDRIEKMKTYDEKSLLAAEPSLSPRQLPNLKSFLYDYLLKCLRTINTSDATEIILADLS